MRNGSSRCARGLQARFQKPNWRSIDGGTVSCSIELTLVRFRSLDAHSGKLSCRRAGNSTFFPRSIAKARARRARVVRGMMTSSI